MLAWVHVTSLLATDIYMCRLHGHPCASSVRGTTRWFLKARTDIIRSCTNTSLAFVKAMDNPETTVSIKLGKSI